MLKGDFSTEVKKRLGLTDEQFNSFVEAVKSEEETDITLPEMHYFTPDEFSQFKTNTKATKKPAWVEESIKDWKGEKGLDFQGKSFDAIYEFAKQEGFNEASKKPDERYNDLKGKFDALLQENDGYKKQLEQKDSEMFLTSSRAKLTSKVGFSTTILPEQIYTLYSQEFSPVNHEGKLGVKLNGASEILRDDRYNPFDAESHFLSYAEKFKVKDSINPNGASNNDPSNPVFADRKAYDKWVQDNKPDDKTRGKVWLDSLKQHPEIAE